MRRACLCLSFVLLIAARDASACGDKLLQISRGVRYQRANAVKPATIVMLVSPSFDHRTADHLRAELIMVGHTVKLVDDPAQFARALATRSDIVLTDADSLPAVTETIGASASRPTIIPLLDRSTKAAADIQARFPFVMMMAARGFEHVSVISKAMR